MVDQNVPLPTKPTALTPLTPTASAAVAIKKTATFDVRAMDDNRRAMGDRGRSQDRLEQHVQERNVSRYAVWHFLRDYPKQVASLAKAKSVSTNMHEFLSWAQGTVALT